MKRVRRSHALTWAVVLASLACAGAVQFGGGQSRAGIRVRRSPVGAAAKQAEQPRLPESRVSPDLLEMARDPGAQEKRVRVILQTGGAADPALTSILGRRDVKSDAQLRTVGARVLELPARLVERLAESKGVRFVSLDRETVSFGHVSETTGADDVRTTSGTNVNGLDGTGVGIAVLDSGVDTNHMAFLDRGKGVRVVYSKDFTGEGRTDDPNGHGTHVASIAAGNGRISNSAYVGIAPNANVINLRVLNGLGTGRVSYILGALEWVLQNRAAYNIKVVNLSLGTQAVESYRNDPVCRAVRKLVNAGVVVVAAAGNLGKDASGQKLYGAIHSPGVEPSAITVGATNTFGTDQRSDDTVASYSSRGPTRGGTTDLLGVRRHDNLLKPDLVAPGNRIIDAAAEDNYLITQHPELDAGVSGSDKRRMMYLNGTSMATPVVAGAAALLLQANPKLTPNMVKALLMYTAQPLANNNMLEQGAGELNVEGAVRLAKLVRTDLGALTPLGAPLLTSAPPVRQSTIAGETFAWSRGLVLGYGFATGTELITTYQKIYALGVLVTDGVLTSNGVLVTDVLGTDGVLVTDRTMLSSGVLVTDHVEFSGGGVMGSGSVYMSTGVLVTDSFFAADGVLVTDGALTADAIAQALSATTKGDPVSVTQRPADTGQDSLDY